MHMHETYPSFRIDSFGRLQQIYKDNKILRQEIFRRFKSLKAYGLFKAPTI